MEIITLSWYAYQSERFIIYYRLISQSSITSKVKAKMLDAIRSQFQAKHVNDSMFMEDLSMQRQVRNQQYYACIKIFTW